MVYSSWLAVRDSWFVPRGSWLVPRGSWLVIRGSCLVARHFLLVNGNIGTGNTSTLATFPKSIAGWDRCDSCARWDGCTTADCSSAHDSGLGATAAPTCTSAGTPWRASWAGCPTPCTAQARPQPSRSTADWPASRFHARPATTGTSRISFPSLDKQMCSFSVPPETFRGLHPLAH